MTVAKHLQAHLAVAARNEKAEADPEDPASASASIAEPCWIFDAFPELGSALFLRCRDCHRRFVFLRFSAALR